MEISKGEFEVKLGHILHDIKDLQKAIIRMKLEKKEGHEHQLSNWELLGEEISSKWVGRTAGRRNQGAEREEVVEQLTVDRSVIVASLLEKEKEHSKAFKVWAEVLTGKTVAIMPYIVLVEVVAAVRRRTADKELALKIKKELLSAGSVNFTIVDPEAALEASDIAIETGMRGMDAIVVQTAKEYGTSLVTLDNEMINKATGIVKIKEL